MGSVEKTPLLGPSTGASKPQGQEKVRGKKIGGRKSTREAASRASESLRSGAQESPPTISLHRQLKARFTGAEGTKTEAVSKHVLGKRILQKAEHAREIVTKVLSLKSPVLRAIYYRVRTSVQKGTGGPQAFTELHQLGATLGAVNIAAALSEIGAAIGSCCIQINELRSRGQATPKAVLKAIAKATTIDRPLVRDLTNLSYGIVLLTRSAASLGHKVSPVVLASLGIAVKALGAAGAGLTALYGVVKAGFGIKDTIVSAKKLNRAKKNLEEFDASYPSPLRAVQQLKRLRLETAVKNAHKELTQGILKACLGTFVTVGGALSFAAFFTMGATAIGLVVAGLVVGVAATAVQIANLVYQKKAQKRLDQEFHQVLTSYPLEGPEWESLAKELSIDPRLKTPEEREQALKDYCFFKPPPHRPKQPPEPDERGVVETSLD